MSKIELTLNQDQAQMILDALEILNPDPTEDIEEQIEETEQIVTTAAVSEIPELVEMEADQIQICLNAIEILSPDDPDAEDIRAGLETTLRDACGEAVGMEP